MTQQKTKVMVLGLGGLLLTCCLLFLGCGLYGPLRRLLMNPDTNGVTVTAGSLEVVLPRSRIPDDVFVSPTGRWLVFPTEDVSHWFILNTQTGQERTISFNFDADVRWLNEEEFAAGYWIVKATDLAVLKLEVFYTPNHKNGITALEVLRGARRVYLLPERITGGVDLMSDDPAYPYGFDAFGIDDGQKPEGVRDSEYTYQVLQERFPETEFVVVKPWYFQPMAGIRNPKYTKFKDTPLATYWHYDFPSPDGRFYARSASENWGTNLEIYQCGHKLVAHAVKDNWYIVPKGWVYDSSGFYFLLRPQVGYFTAGEVPISILRLNIPSEVLASAPAYEGEGFCE